MSVVLGVPHALSDLDGRLRIRQAGRARRLVIIWCLAQVPLYLLVEGLWWSGYFGDAGGLTAHLSPIVPAVVALGCASALVIVAAGRPPDGGWVTGIVWVLMAATAAWGAWEMHLAASSLQQTAATTTLSAVWPLLAPTAAPSPDAATQLQAYIRQQTSRQAFLVFLLLVYVQFDVLRYLSVPRYTLPAFLLLPCALIAASCLSPSLTLQVPEVVAAVLLAGYAAVMGLYVARRLRQEFASGLDAADRLTPTPRLPHPHSADHKIDRILNHVLTNLMADAAGCIDMFVESPQLHGERLHHALECLSRGMQWCKKRQALARIAAGTYLPQVSVVKLQQMGLSLIAGRAVRFVAPDEAVVADPLLLELLLEPALCNAFRHGAHPDPQVTLTFRLSSPPPRTRSPPNHRRLSIEIANIADPDHPVTEGALHEAGIEADEPLSPSNDRIGLQQILMVAAAQGIPIHLSQVGSTVKFSVRLDVELAPLDFDQDPSSSQLDAISCSLPPLRYYCLDDSPIATRVLVHTLATHAAPAAVVARGATVQEAESFAVDALQNADIVILDQHLDYPTAMIRGTDVAQQLLSGGFQGLICIRSANVAEADRAEYLRYGAHYVLGKDVRGAEVVARLHAAYLRHINGEDVFRSVPNAVGHLGDSLARRLSWGSLAVNDQSCPASYQSLLGFAKTQTKGSIRDFLAVAPSPPRRRSLDSMHSPPQSIIPADPPYGPYCFSPPSGPPPENVSLLARAIINNMTSPTRNHSFRRPASKTNDSRRSSVSGKDPLSGIPSIPVSGSLYDLQPCPVRPASRGMGRPLSGTASWASSTESFGVGVGRMHSKGTGRDIPRLSPLRPMGDHPMMTLQSCNSPISPNSAPAVVNGIPIHSSGSPGPGNTRVLSPLQPGPQHYQRSHVQPV